MPTRAPLLISLSLVPLLLGSLACGDPGPEAGQVSDEARAPAGAQGAMEATPPPVTLTERQARGKAVFEGVCWTCHGSSARGNGPVVQGGAVEAPPDLTRGEYPRLSRDQLVARFEDALAGQDTAHPHMRNVISFLTEESFTDALAYLPALLHPPEVPGSAMEGWKIYDFRCSSCHGPQGRGQGPVADQLVVAPANFAVDTLIAAGDFQGLYDRIRAGGGEVHGSAMPPWGHIFGEEEIWDLVAFISTFQPHRLSPPPTDP